GGAELGGERDVTVGQVRLAGREGRVGRGQQRREGLVDAGQVTRVGNHDDRAAPGARGGDGGAGDLFRPGGAGKRRPGGAGRAARGERAEERRSRRVPGPGAGIRARGPAPRQAGRLAPGGFRGRRFGGG